MVSLHGVAVLSARGREESMLPTGALAPPEDDPNAPARMQVMEDASKALPATPPPIADRTRLPA